MAWTEAQIADLKRLWTVAHEFDDPAMMLGDEGFQDLFAQFCQTVKSPGLVIAHQACVARNVCDKNGGKPAFQALSPSPRRLTTKDRRIHAGGMAVEWRLLAIGLSR